MKFLSALAVIMSAAYAQQQQQQQGEGYQPAPGEEYVPQQNWQGLNRGLGRGQVLSYGRGLGGYGGYGAYGQPTRQGYTYSKRSSIRPRDIKAFQAAPLDSYYATLEKPTETIKASCEFDFLGYSDSSGRVELEQKPGDLTTILGGFWGVKPGMHAMKIHEYGDLEYGCESTGRVYNPLGAKQGHAHFDIMDRRVGDLEQMSVRWSTESEYKQRDLLVMLSGPNSVLGRAMVLYEREDDHDQVEHPATTKKDLRVREGMGERIACCVIGLAKGEGKDKPKPKPKADTKLKVAPVVKAAPKVAVRKASVSRRAYVPQVQ